VQVDSSNHPVTGIRLFLEGKKNDRLGVHLQHLSATPGAVTVLGEAASAEDVAVNERDYIEPVRSPLLSHICTAPVQYNGARIDDCAAIVTSAWLEVRDVCCLKKVLFLRLGFSGVAAMKIRRSEWDGPFVVPRKSGSLSARAQCRAVRWPGAGAGAASGGGGGELRHIPQGPAGAAPGSEDGQAH